MVLAAIVVVSNVTPVIARPTVTASESLFEPRADVDLPRLLERVVDAGIPGVVARVQEGREVRALTAGVGDLRTGEALRPHARFRAGSITKTFVATVVLQLVGEGLLDLDEPVEGALPGLLPDGDVITARQLLNHTSGLFNYTADPDALAGIEEHPAVEPEDLVAVATAHPLSFPPGTDFHYSNTGYIVAGLLVEAVTGNGLARELRRRIFDTLALEHTSFPVDTGRIRGYHARGYLPADLAPTRDGEPMDVTEINASWAWAAGALVSNARDLSRFYRSLLGGELLDPGLLEQMQTTIEDPDYPGEAYGLGIMWIDTPCGRFWGHNGSIAGYHSSALRNEDADRSVVFALTMSPLPPASEGPFAEAFDLALCGTEGTTAAVG